MSLGSISHEGRRLEELIERLDTLPDPQVREMAQECLHSLLQLYGEGLGRILQLVNNAGTEGDKVRDALLRDKLVRGLLLIHGLHPLRARFRNGIFYFNVIVQGS